MRLHEMSIYDTLFRWRLCLEAPQMRMTTDTTARMAVLTLCVAIVIMRLLRPEIAFDGASLGALALAALIAIAPVLRERSRDGQAEAVEPLRLRTVSALKQSISDAGLLLDESRGTYASLNETRPLELALAGARATLGLRLKSLTEQARLDSHGADAASCLNALNTAGVTTGEQFRALDGLLKLLEQSTRPGAQAEPHAAEELLSTAIGVIEMLDGTLS